jgi:hypothetical protein
MERYGNGGLELDFRRIRHRRRRALRPVHQPATGTPPTPTTAATGRNACAKTSIRTSRSRPKPSIRARRGLEDAIEALIDDIDGWNALYAAQDRDRAVLRAVADAIGGLAGTAATEPKGAQECEATRLDRAYVATPAAAWERLRGEAVRERRPGGRPHAPQPTEPATGGGSFVGRPVREFTDPFALEVHRAIDAPGHGRAELPVLPVYVPRAHDRNLRAAVERAAGGESVMVTLVAGSSTGKTRACWEALRAVPDGWRLWHPLHPSPADAAAADLSRVGPRTVIWLNEAQTYLEPAGPGERIATGLRELLDDPGRGPVLVLATRGPTPSGVP